MSQPPSEIRAPMRWRFSANNTHLYPGALLRSLDAPSENHLSAGDELQVEFSDGVVAIGQLRQADAHAAVLAMPAYRSRHGTTVTERTWCMVPGGESGLVRVQKRLPAD